MGRSLRRAKRYRPKLTVKRKRQPMCKAAVPLVLHTNEPTIPAKLPQSALQWDTMKTYVRNYDRAGLTQDPNALYAITDVDAEAQKDDQHAIEQEEPHDDDLRALLSLERQHGKSPPAKLSAHQRQIMERLIAAHGDDVEGMAKDRKLNQMLLPASKLRKLLLSYHHGVSHRFQAPHKHNRFKPC